jgi:spore coat polysaccharide biosynthesis protein SpsF
MIRMLKTLGIVHACFGSSRFCANAARRLGGRSLLEWVVRRVTDSMRLDGVIVVACNAAERHRLDRLVPRDVPVFLTEHQDMLTRYLRALEEFPAEAVVRVHGDDPFIDPGLIDRLVTVAEARPNCDYATYSLRDGRPAIHSPVGVYAEWFRTKALRRADRLATEPADREHVSRNLYGHPDKFNVCLIPAPEQIDRDDLRLTIDSDEDWDHTLSIYEALGPEALDWQRIADLLDHQPALRSRMAALNRAGAGS